MPGLCRMQPPAFPTARQESCADKSNQSSEISVATHFSIELSFASEKGAPRVFPDLSCTVLRWEEQDRVFLAPLIPRGTSWDAPVRAQHPNLSTQVNPTRHDFCVYFAGKTSQGLKVFDELLNWIFKGIPTQYLPFPRRMHDLKAEVGWSRQYLRAAPWCPAWLGRWGNALGGPMLAAVMHCLKEKC